MGFGTCSNAAAGLCQTAHAVIELYALPLPAVHLHLGPMTRDALLTLAGPAWELHADDRARQSASSGPAIARSPSPHPSHPPPRRCRRSRWHPWFREASHERPATCPAIDRRVVVQSLMWLWLIFLSVLAALGYQALSDQADQERLDSRLQRLEAQATGRRDDRGHPAAPGRRDGR